MQCRWLLIKNQQRLWFVQMFAKVIKRMWIKSILNWYLPIIGNQFTDKFTIFKSSLKPRVVFFILHTSNVCLQATNTRFRFIWNLDFLHPRGNFFSGCKNLHSSLSLCWLKTKQKTAERFVQWRHRPQVRKTQKI